MAGHVLALHSYECYIILHCALAALHAVEASLTLEANDRRETLSATIVKCQLIPQYRHSLACVLVICSYIGMLQDYNEGILHE